VDLLEYRILGRTGIKVSAIGMGGENLEKKSFADTEALIDCALSEGINVIDLYNSNPEVRDNVGKALNKYPRNSFVIQGHLGSVWHQGQYLRTRNIRDVVTAFEDYLIRMKLEYVDAGMLHYVDDMKDFDTIFDGEIIRYAKELKEKGIIKSIGISTHNTDIALRAAETGLIDLIMFSINPAFDMLPAVEDVYQLFEENTYKNMTFAGTDPRRAHLYQTCHTAGVALTVMKGYGAGLLLSDQQSPFKKALTPVQCLHYCLTRPAVASVFVGVSDTDQIRAATAYVGASQKEKDYSAVLANAPRSAFSGQCMYCGHCAPCSKNIDIALVNKYLDLASIQKSLPETLKNHYDLLEHHAGECSKCGLCMKNCPFGVDVICKMKLAVQLFGR
jgi:predicted aldo/keto reductase-like oxidoreductase